MSAKRNLKGHLREYGYSDLPGLSVVARQSTRIDIHGALSEAEGDKPALFWQGKDSPWVVVMRLDDFMELYRSWEIDTKETRDLPFT